MARFYISLRVEIGGAASLHLPGALVTRRVFSIITINSAYQVKTNNLQVHIGTVAVSISISTGPYISVR